jgi:hypothetical protein
VRPSCRALSEALASAVGRVAPAPGAAMPVPASTASLSTLTMLTLAGSMRSSAAAPVIVLPGHTCPMVRAVTPWVRAGAVSLRVEEGFFAPV